MIWSSIIIVDIFLKLFPSYINNKYIDYGIYKGLYTTEENYQFITHLESDIKDYYIDVDNRNICEVTVFPATYLMADAKVVAPDTWDCMGLHIANIDSWVSKRRVSIPITSNPIINYFEYFKTKPEHMIVIYYFVKDFVKNSNKYEINNFIKEHYFLDLNKEYTLSNLLIYKLANYFTS